MSFEDFLLNFYIRLFRDLLRLSSVFLLSEALGKQTKKTPGGGERRTKKRLPKLRPRPRLGPGLSSELVDTSVYFFLGEGKASLLNPPL